MKTKKHLFPLALLLTLPLVGCTPSSNITVTPVNNNPTNSNSGTPTNDNQNTSGDNQESTGTNTSGTDEGNNGQNTGGNEGEKVEVLSIDEILEKLEATFNVSFEDDEYTGGYYYCQSSSNSKSAVQNAVSKIDFLTLDGEVTSYEYEDLSGYEAYMANADGSVELNIYTYDDEDGGCLEFDLYESYSSEVSSWADIDVESFFSTSITIPGPDGCSSFEYYGEEGYVEVYAYGGSSANYADKLEEAGFYVEYDSDFEMYLADSSDESISIYFFDDAEYDCIDIMIFEFGE